MYVKIIIYVEFELFFYHWTRGSIYNNNKNYNIKTHLSKYEMSKYTWKKIINAFLIMLSFTYFGIKVKKLSK